ncbi:hypothetical protein CAPTEDRAFT_190637, partial [Capitella teleta]
MPRKKSLSRASPFPKGGVASEILECYSLVPQPPTALLNGHVLHIYTASQRSPAATAKVILEHGWFTDYGKVKVSFAIDSLVNKTLKKFRKLTNINERQKLESICQGDFNLTIAVPTKTCEQQLEPISEPSPRVSTPSPLKTRQIAKCRRCATLRLTLKKCIHRKNARYAELTSKLRDLRTKLRPVKRLNEMIKRKDAVISRLKVTIKQLKSADSMKKLQTLTNSIERYKGQALSAKQSEEGTLKEYKNKYEEEIAAIIMKEEHIHPIELKKSGKTHSLAMRMFVYECLMANMPTSQVNSHISNVSSFFNLNSFDVPSRSTIERMGVELGTFSDIQAGDFLYNETNLTLGFDATTQEGVHVNSIHVTSPDVCIVLSLEQLPGGTAEDYSWHIISTLQHIAKVYSSYQSLNYSIVFEKIKMNVTCTMSDRAKVNHAAVRLVNSSLGKELVEVNCHVHPLDSMASVCKSALREAEVQRGLKASLFGSGCGAEHIILAFNKMRFKDCKGDATGFKVFLVEKGLGLGLMK